MLRRHGGRLGIRTVRDLLAHLPRRYDDLRALSTIAAASELPDGTPVSVRASVGSLRVEQTWRRRVQRTVAVLRDQTGEMGVTWFGRRYIERRLREGDTIVASGRVRRRGFIAHLDSPEFQRDDGGELLHAGRIVPVYPLTAGLAARTLRGAMRAALDRFGPYPEYLPPSLRAGLPAIGEAFEGAHFPTDFHQRDRALERLAHDELLALQLGMVARRRQRQRASAPAIVVDPPAEDRLVASIRAGLARRLGREVALTDDQEAAIAAIRHDVGRGRPMLRLVQGDVGSGKTVIAAHALALAALAGGQSALLAPTDLLARQHLATLGELLEDAGLPVTLLTGSLSAAGRRAALDGIRGGRAGVVVGTHALLGEGVDFASLDLVVVDEQHRFGVAQREALAAKGRTPHVLLMTATPIPRTLGQVLYADLDVSDVRAAPSGRPRVRTGIRGSAALPAAWQRVREEAAAGHRTFVVAPLITPGDDVDMPVLDGGQAAARADVDEPPSSAPVAGPDGAGSVDESATARAAEAVHAHLLEVLSPLRVGLVHGRMRALDRDAEMARFRDGELDVLVGTTVIEVGVDVPEATMMVVLSADRFGLSQLHQLRGRVGRGTEDSYCVLVSDAPDDSVAMARLRAIVELRDGFALAQRDFELRREGDVLGLMQSGLPRLRVASLAREEHRALAVRCRELAERTLDEDGSLPASQTALRDELEHGWLADVASGDVVVEEGMGA